MAVNKYLKTLANSSPAFSNTSIQTLITNIVSDDSTANFASRTYNIIHKAETSSNITDEQRTDLNNSLDVRSYLNLGRYCYNLEQHTVKILDGSLGEVDAGANSGEDVPTFLDHLTSVQGFINTIPFLYGVTADSLNKGLIGHFGTLSGTIDSSLISLKEIVDRISSQSLSEDTAYQLAVQAVSDHIDVMDGSSASDILTYESLLSAMETAAINFGSALLSSDVTNLTNIRSTINTQIALEETNLGTIKTYEKTLHVHYRYLNFAENKEIRSFLVRTSQSTDWKKYFENYEVNFAFDNAIYSSDQPLSSIKTQLVNSVLKLRGLPDVTEYADLDSVASKSLKDLRLKDKIPTETYRTSEQIIKRACELIGLETKNQTVYQNSKKLLENMNAYDRAIIEYEIEAYQDVNTLS